MHRVLFKIRLVAQSSKVSQVVEQPEPDIVRVNPRTRRVRHAILDAAFDVLLTEGAECVTATRVAERADVARTTIYRHWPDQASLLLATIDTVTSPHHPSPDLGVLDRDLRSALENLRTRLVVHETRAVFGALASHAHHDQAFAAAQRRFVEQLVQPVAALLEAARTRGDVRAGMDCQLEAMLLAGPIVHHHLMLHADIPDELIDDVVGRWLAVHDLS